MVELSQSSESSTSDKNYIFRLIEKVGNIDQSLNYTHAHLSNQKSLLPIITY